MVSKRSGTSDVPVGLPQPVPKRRRSNGRNLGQIDIPAHMNALRTNGHVASAEHDCRSPDENKDKSITLASTAKFADLTVAPFLTRHVPNQYAPLGGLSGTQSVPPKDSNSKYCYRHRPDLLCRRQADEPSMEQLQRVRRHSSQVVRIQLTMKQDLDTLSQDDRQGIAHVWSLFSAAPSKHRNLMLQGILAQCCFPQLSYLSASVRDLLKIDFMSALPPEVSFKILCFLDTTSLCKAAQVSRRWRQLADDDVVWHRMCEQHIDRKCTRCGWGLPSMERKRLRASKRQIQLRAAGRGISDWSPNITPNPETYEELAGQSGQIDIANEPMEKGSLRPPKASLPLAARGNMLVPSSDIDYFMKSRPWKDVYKDRFKVGTNWKYGRCSTKTFRGHTNGVMCLQFCDNILVTGSYDATIKVWDIETGHEVRTLTGHLKGIRCLQFDDTKLISGSLDETLRVWNWRTGECLSTYRGHDGAVIGLHFNGDLLVSASVDKTIKIWNFRDKTIFTLRGHTDWVNAVRIDVTSRTVFSASDDLTIRLWDLDTKKCLRVLKGHVGQVQQIVLLHNDFEMDDQVEDTQADESTSQTSSDEVSSPEMPQVTSAAADCRYDKTFNAGGDRKPPPRYIMTGALDSTIRLWEVPTGRCVKTLFGHVEGVWALAADALRVVSGAEDRMVKVWDARTGACEKTYTGHAGPVTCIGLSDSRMCSGSEDGEVRMYCFKDES